MLKFDEVSFSVNLDHLVWGDLTLARPGGASEARRGIFDLEFSSSRRCSGLEFHDFS